MRLKVIKTVYSRRNYEKREREREGWCVNVAIVGQQQPRHTSLLGRFILPVNRAPPPPRSTCESVLTCKKKKKKNLIRQTHRYVLLGPWATTLPYIPPSPTPRRKTFFHHRGRPWMEDTFDEAFRPPFVSKKSSRNVYIYICVCIYL